MAVFALSASPDGVGTLTVSGDVDISSVDEFIEAARSCLAGGASILEVDLGEVSFMDSSGLGALVRLRQEAADAGARFRLADVPRSIARLLTLTGLDDLFGAQDDE